MQSLKHLDEEMIKTIISDSPIKVEYAYTDEQEHQIVERLKKIMPLEIKALRDVGSHATADALERLFHKILGLKAS